VSRAVNVRIPLAAHLAAIRTSSTPQELEAHFRATFDRYGHRTSERIREAVRERGRELCELHDTRGLVPHFHRRTRRLSVCGETRILGRGYNAAGVRYVWAFADEWTTQTLRSHGCSEALTREIMDCWKWYPHRALRAIERRAARKSAMNAQRGRKR
jgi:hypothetical protein